MAYKVTQINSPGTEGGVQDLDPPGVGYEVAYTEETRNGELIVIWEHDGGHNAERKLGKLVDAVEALGDQVGDAGLVTKGGGGE